MLHIILYVIGFNSVSDQGEMKWALFISLLDKKDYSEMRYALNITLPVKKE